MTMEELKLNDLNSISNSIANEAISNVRAKVKEAFDMGWTRCEDAVLNNFNNGNYSKFNLNYLLNNMLNEVRGLTSANYMHHKVSLEASINNIKKSLDISDYKVRKCVESLDGRHLVRKEGNGPSTRYFVGFESIEFLTQLQIMMDSLKKQMV